MPWLLGQMAMPLPCATAATAVFAGLAGGSAAEATSPAKLERFAKVARSAVFVVRAAAQQRTRPSLTDSPPRAV